jgi:hypothetical protein
MKKRPDPWARAATEDEALEALKKLPDEAPIFGHSRPVLELLTTGGPTIDEIASSEALFTQLSSYLVLNLARGVLVLRAEVKRLTEGKKQHALNVGEVLLEMDQHSGLDNCPFCGEETKAGGIGHEEDCPLKPLVVSCARKGCPFCEDDV